jgi:hypothetical protein
MENKLKKIDFNAHSWDSENTYKLLFTLTRWTEVAHPVGFHAESVGNETNLNSQVELKASMVNENDSHSLGRGGAPKKSASAKVSHPDSN